MDASLRFVQWISLNFLSRRHSSQNFKLAHDRNLPSRDTIGHTQPGAIS